MDNTERVSLYKAIPRNTWMQIKSHRINFYANEVFLKAITALFTVYFLI